MFKFFRSPAPTEAATNFRSSESQNGSEDSEAVLATSDRPTPPEESEALVSNVSRWRAYHMAVAATVKRNAGLLLIVAAQAFFSLMNVAVKFLNNIDPPVSAFELIVVRMAITYVCSMAYMLITKVPDPWLGPKGIRSLLIFRGFSGFFGLFGIYYSLQYLSLSDATVLTFLSPLCTGISGALFLKEKYTKAQGFASLCSLIGVVLIARPSFLFATPRPPTLAINEIDFSFTPDDSEKGSPEQRLIAVGAAMLGVLGSTGAYTTISAMGKRAHPMHAMISFSSQSVIAASIAMVVNKVPFIIPTKIEWLAMLIMIGIFGFAAQILLTMGLQRETAGRGSIAIYSQIVFASILERVFFKAASSFLSMTGTLIIVSAALYVALTKERAKKAKTNVKLSGVSEAALEEGLTASLLKGQTEDPSIKRVTGTNASQTNTGNMTTPSTVHGNEERSLRN